MKLVCIDNDATGYLKRNRHENLTIGKIYDGLDGGAAYLIRDDSGSPCWYLMNRFVTLEEWRAKQIESVL